MQAPTNQYMLETFTINGLAANNTPRATIVQFPATNAVVKKKYLSQIFATLAVSLGTFAAGLGKGYSSPAIDSLQQTRPATSTASLFESMISTTSSPTFAVNSSSASNVVIKSTADAVLTITSQEASWVASLSFLGALFGAMFGGVAMKYGRRNVLLAVSVPFSASWLLTAFAPNVQMMFVTSFIGGFCCAIVLTVSQVYISEISTPSIRGCLNAVMKIFGQIGVLISYAMGAYLDWKRLALTISMAPMALFFAMLYVPETASYLALNGRDREAAKSLRWIKGDDDNYEIARELATIKANIARSRRRRELHLREDERVVYDDLYRPIVVTCGLMFFHRFSGAHLFNYYAVTIFKRTFVGMNPHGGAILVGLVQLTASLLSGLLIDTVGRLPLLIVSGVFMSIALASFGSFAYYVARIQSFEIAAQYDWIPLTCVLTFTIAFALGINPISWLMVGELFPLRYRGLGSSIAMSFSYGCAFVNVKTFVDFEESFGLYGTYWLYSACSVAGLCFVVCCVPETKGKDLEEMNRNNVVLRT